MGRMRREFVGLVGVGLCVALLGTACGSDAEDQAAPASGGTVSETPATDLSTAEGAGAPAASPDGGAAPPESGAAPAPAPGRNPAGQHPGGPAAADRKPSAAPPATTASAAGVNSGAPVEPAGPGAAKPSADGPSSPGPPAPGPGAIAGPSRPGSELVLGSFGIENGVLAAVSGPVAPAIRAWAADVNSRGGLNGHPVRVVLADSGGDPARAQAIARQMVEKDKVIAFLHPYTIGELDPIMPYLESKGVPVIGQMGGDPRSDYSVMMFNPLQGADKGLGWELVFDVVKQTDKRKAAIMYCREATICQNQRERVASVLPYDGLELVYEAQVSLAQPDYTAEALGAQRAGADVVLLFMDINSIARWSKSAKRQGYTPVLATAHQVAIDYTLPYAKDLDGLLLGGRVPPYDGPMLADYRQAMGKYQPKGVKGDMGSGAWVVGKLLERLAPLLDADPTSAELVELLYGLKSERLGGLLPGITFPRGKDRSNVNICAIPTKFTGGRFVPHDAQASFVCAPEFKP